MKNNKIIIGSAMFLLTSIIALGIKISQADIGNKNPEAVNLAEVIKQVLQQKELYTANQFRFQHILVENNPEFSNDEIKINIKLWGLADNGRMDMVSVDKDTASSFNNSFLIMPAADKSCLAMAGNYKCNSVAETREDGQVPVTSNFYKERQEQYPFNILKLLQAEQVDLEKPLEQNLTENDAKKILIVLYVYPANQRNDDLEQYVQIDLDLKTNQLFKYSLLTKDKTEINTVTFLEDKVVNDLDPELFFTEEYWKNELGLTAGTLSFEEQ